MQNTEKENVIDFEDNADFEDLLHGDSKQVLTEAILADVGKALTTPDLATAGSYIISSSEEYQLWYHKGEKGAKSWTEVRVMNWALDQYNKELEHRKARHAADPTAETGSVYYLAPWIIADLAFNTGWVPDETPTVEFERLLWKHYPYVWVDTSRAPKN